MSITDENNPGEAGRIYQKTKVSITSLCTRGILILMNLIA